MIVSETSKDPPTVSGAARKAPTLSRNMLERRDRVREPHWANLPNKDGDSPLNCLIALAEEIRLLAVEAQRREALSTSAIHILLLFDETVATWHANDLATELKLSKSVIHQGLVELRRRDLIQRGPRGSATSIPLACSAEGTAVACRLRQWAAPLAEMLRSLPTDQHAVLSETALTSARALRAARPKPAPSCKK